MKQRIFGLRRVREVAAWCDAQLAENEAYSLRSTLFGAPQLPLFEAKDSAGECSLLTADDPMVLESVEQVVKKRREALLGLQDKLSSGGSIDGGRILAFITKLSLSEGASEELSQEFFDVHNQPPWDTWLAYIPVGEEGYPTLLSWVPAALIERVEAGLDVNWERSIRWADATILESPEVQLLLDS